MDILGPKQQKQPKPKSTINSFWFGLAAGLIVPMITIIIAYYHKYSVYMTVHEFYIKFIHWKLFSAFISLCALPDMLVFFIFIWGNRLIGARGALTAIFIITVVVVIFKFFI